MLSGCPPPRPQGDLRERLAQGLNADGDRSNARLVEDSQTTTLTLVAADWLPGWQIVDVLGRTMPHPRRFYAALSDRGRAVVLTGNGRAFSAVLLEAGVRVDSAETAGAIGAVYLDATRDFRAYAYRIDSVEDIEWLPQPTAAEATRRDTLRAAYRGQIRPLRAEGGDDRWQVVTWMVEGRTLTRHELNIVPGLPASDRITVHEQDIPVSYSR